MLVNAGESPSNEEKPESDIYVVLHKNTENGQNE